MVPDFFIPTSAAVTAAVYSSPKTCAAAPKTQAGRPPDAPALVG